MSILVTGGAGYIGSHTVHQLMDDRSQANRSIVVLDDLSTGNRASVPERAVFVQGNVGDSELVSRVLREHQIKSVIHFAGSITVSESVAQPLKYYENNTANSLRLLRTCVAEKVNQFVFSSTAAVYGSPKTLPVNEDAEVAPVSPYGTSKLMTEWMIRDLVISRPEFRAVVLRYFNVAGAKIGGGLGQRVKNATHLIKVASEVVCGLRTQVEILGTDYKTRDGTGIRDYIHVEDLARAHLDAIHYLDQGGQTQVLNCGYGHGFTVREVLSMMKKVSGVDFKVVESARRPGDADAIVAEASRIKQVLGWKPRYDDLELICKTALDWERTSNSQTKA